MIKKITRREIRIKKHGRLRNRLNGTPERPRACIFRSNSNLYIQFVDDEEGKVMTGFSTRSKEFQKGCKESKNNIGRAKEFGKFVGSKSKEKNIEKIIFDRAGYKYHGKVRAMADGMREEGIKF